MGGGVVCGACHISKVNNSMNVLLVISILEFPVFCEHNLL